MPKKFSIAAKKEWLERYESGKSEVSIAKESKCDARTVKKGIEEARRERDAQIARTELFKNALLNHQERLLDKLKEILANLKVPPKDWAPLSWYRNGESIFSEDNRSMARGQSHEVYPTVTDAGDQFDMVEDMLKQHLRNDKLWKILARHEKAYASHRLERIALQRKVVALLQKETGYKLEEGNDVRPPFLYSYTTGDLFFKMTLRYTFGYNAPDDWQGKIVVDTSGGHVRYHPGTILAEVPGKEKECRQKLLDAFGKMQDLPELATVVNTFRELEAATLRARQAMEEVLVLGLVPGQCKVCRRLGM
jgi:hypothetical protein